MGEFTNQRRPCCSSPPPVGTDVALEWARDAIGATFWPARTAATPIRLHRDRLLRRHDGAADLKKQFLAFERLIDPAELAAIKRQTNEWEAEYAALGRHPEPRPLNLDPGYITAAKLVLASTKDHAHRIYLQDGIYAEVTLAYRHRRWQPLEWTYPDYRRDDYQRVLYAVPRVAVELRRR